MERRMYRAWSPDVGAAQAYFRERNSRAAETESAMRQAGALRVDVFGAGGSWLIYAEIAGQTVKEPGDVDGEVHCFDPALLFPEAASVLSAWPGEAAPRLFARMTDIFHYQRPAGREHWSRNGGTEGYGRIARLKPDQVASYVFYHYQYQEEKPGDGDKYGIIGLHEELLFFYAERPSTVEPAPYPGRLTTSSTPEDWGAAMQPHFIEWEQAGGSERIWLNLDRVLAARLPEKG